MLFRAIISRRGFTLIELLMVIAIIGILASLLSVAVPQVRDSAHRAACVSNLRQIGALTHSYAADHGNQLPRSREGGLFSFASNVLPDVNFGGQNGSRMSKLFYCESDQSGGVATYSITGGNSSDNNGLYVRSSEHDYVEGRMPISAYPRPAQTFLLVEAPSASRTYTLRGVGAIMTPQEQFNSGGTAMHGKLGSHYLYLDGHVALLATPMLPDKSRMPTYDQWQLGYQAQ